jgi:high-affinity iron transporter
MPAGLLTSREAQQTGRVIYMANCEICHGVKGDGRGQRREGMNPPPADLMAPPWSDKSGAPRMYAVIQNGVRGSAMPSWPMLSDQQIWDIVAYLHSLNSP